MQPLPTMSKQQSYSSNPALTSLPLTPPVDLRCYGLRFTAMLMYACVIAAPVFSYFSKIVKLLLKQERSLIEVVDTSGRSAVCLSSSHKYGSKLSLGTLGIEKRNEQMPRAIVEVYDTSDSESAGPRACHGPALGGALRSPGPFVQAH